MTLKFFVSSYDPAKTVFVLKKNRLLYCLYVRPGSSFVFLQLYQDGQLGGKAEKPLLVPKDVVNMSIKTFDYIPPYETHKLGVLYVGPNQTNNETEILCNTCGSVRYTEFLSVSIQTIIFVPR